MTSYTGQVFACLEALSERRSGVYTGRIQMAIQNHTFISSFPSHQWGNLLHMVTRCQGARSIRIWTEVMIIFLYLTESNWNFSMNWTYLNHIWTWTDWKCHTFICVLCSWFWMWYRMIVMHFDLNLKLEIFFLRWKNS